MKNFKSLLLAVAVAAGALFTSCTEDTATTVTIKLDAVSVTSPTAVTGTITAAGVLKSVSLLKDSATSSSTVSGWPKTTFTTGNPIVGADGNYTVRIENLAAGSYTLSATDKNDVQSTQKFTVVDPLQSLSADVTMFCTLNDGSNNTTCASVDGSTFAIKSATATEQAKIDFVFFYHGLYAPSAYAAKNLTATIAAWTTKNATTFVKSTTITYATATYAAVKAAADAAVDTSILTLPDNDVIVFKTAAGKVGVLKVVSVTQGYAPTDKIVISVKVQK